MNIEDFRDYCLSFNGAHEKMPFGKAASDYDRNLLVFCVKDKWFCMVNIDVFDFCNLKCDAAESGELQARYNSVKPAYHMNKKHWVSAYFNGDLPDEMIRRLVRQSYELVVSSLPKKDREVLKAEVR